MLDSSRTFFVMLIRVFYALKLQIDAKLLQPEIGFQTKSDWKTVANTPGTPRLF